MEQLSSNVARSTVILPDELRGDPEIIAVGSIDWPQDADRARKPDLEPERVAELARSIARQGLLQPIGVRRHGPRYRLIFGRRRLEAYRTHRDLLGREVEAMVYPEDLPDDWARIIEIEENEKRQDLTADERAAHTVELAAQLKRLEELTRSESRTKSDFMAEPRPRTGRGHKGLVQKTAEKQKIDHAVVRKRARKVAAVIGEPVDLEGDSPDELLRKAEKFRAAPPAKRRNAQGYLMPDGAVPKARGRAAPLTVLAELNAALDPTYVRTLVRRLRAGEAPDERRIIKAHLMEVGDKLAALEPAAMPEGVEPSLAPVLGWLDATRAWYGREHPPADAGWRRFPLETVLGTVDRIAADLAALRQVLEQRLREASRAEERELEVAPEQEPEIGAGDRAG